VAAEIGPAGLFAAPPRPQFFLQTLVKMRHMRQSTMLALNQLLMLITTAPALRLIASEVSLPAAALSAALNVASSRGGRWKELRNVALTTGAAALWRAMPPVRAV